jgi:hypothetical protein
MSTKRVERMQELQKEIENLKKIISTKDQIIENQQQRITRLRELMDELEREKWSYQSELENLRGW